MTSHRFPIRFDGWYRLLSSALFIPPSDSFVDVADEAVGLRQLLVSVDDPAALAESMRPP